MQRKEFLRLCALLGISIPMQPLLASCKSSDAPTNFQGSVLIIGAGAAGLTAGHLLQQRGIDYTILEASGAYGGRMKRTSSFVDFPIPLGAEWLHVEKGVLSEIVNNSSTQINVQTTPYDMNTDYALFNGQQISLSDVGFTIDQKFINSTWFDFFEEYIVPSVRDKIQLNQIVSSINYENNSVTVVANGQEFKADKIIVTVPVKALQNNAIDFTPSLPTNKLSALSSLKVWDGFKAFIEFTEKFYPAVIAYDIQPASDGQKLYYDASYGQNSNRHVLGLFSVGTGTLPYRNLSDVDLKNYMLNELDSMFNGAASRGYVKHISQNWNNEPFINGAYITDQENWRSVRTLGESVNGILYFAGCSYTNGEDWASVHTAARSAIRAVNEIL